MQKKWTEEQEKIIYGSTGNILVSAAAGSGKTTVLSERVIETIIKGESDISKMLLVTFTNASAAELKQRINSGLRKRFESSSGVDCEEQIKLLPMANIGTIHSFCQNLLRNNFTATSLSKNFEIGEEAELSTLFRKSIDKVMDEYYESGDENFFDMVETLCGKDRDAFENLIRDTINYSKALPDPIGWLQSCADRLLFTKDSSEGKDRLIKIWGEELKKYASIKKNGIKLLYDEIICTASLVNEKYVSFFESESQICDVLETALNKNSWDDIYNDIQGISFSTLPKKSKDTDEILLNYIKSCRDSVKKEIRYLKEKIFYTNSERAISHIASIYSCVKSFVDVLCKIEDNYTILKSQRNLVDFNDLEHFSIKLLENKKNIEKFDNIYIDEYQDTNAAQNRLFELLSDKSNLFAVGDVKQSIYGFRNARPRNFLDLEALYDSDKSKGTALYLSNNFRSHGNIISFINGIFGRIMSPSIGDILYDKKHRLVSGTNFETESKIELNIIEKTINPEELNEELGELGDVEEQLKKDAVLREAEFTARRIYNLVEVEKPLIYDSKRNLKRPISYGDVAVLMRKTKDRSKVIASCLVNMGIPVLCEESSGYFASQEVRVLLSILEIVDNPVRDIPLITVMRSPCFGFDDNQLAEIRINHPDGTFYEAVVNNKDEKCVKFLNELNFYRESCENLSISELIRLILDRTYYERFVCTLNNSRIRKANLLLFCDKAAEFESNGRRSIFEFIQYIRNMIKNNFDFSVSDSDGEGSECVKIMSIHKSKGLEFPAVFLMNTGSAFNFRDLQKNVMYDFDLGIGVDSVIKSRMIKHTNVIKQTMIAKKRSEILSEEMRILYVALTRARDHLFISGSVSNVDKFREKFNRFNNNNVNDISYNISMCSDSLSWLMYALSAGEDIYCDVKYFKAKDIICKNKSGSFDLKSKKIDLGTVTPDEHLQAEFDKKFKYCYNFKKSQSSKMNISDIYHLENESGEIKLKTPVFYEKSTANIEKDLYYRIIHFIIQNLDLNFVSSTDEIYGQIDRMVSQKIIIPSYADKIEKNSIDKIYAFFCSALGQRLISSDFIEREYKFFTYLDCRDLFRYSRNDASQMLVQGVIDCFFQHNGKIVIINYVNKNYSEKVYEKALSKVLKKEVSKTVTIDIY